MNNNSIILQNVYFAYGNTFSILDACLSIEQSDFSFFLGPNGAGKTTVMKLMCGLLTPDQGNILLQGKELHRLPRRDIARTIALVEQDNMYMFPFTVEEIVLMGRYPYGARGAFESKEDEEKAHWAMEVTHTLQFRDRSILTLSGGERRRVEIARALAQEADILLLDEPTSHLDIKQQRELFRLLRRLNKEKGKTLFVISHHLNFIKEYGDHVFFIKDGTIDEWHDKDMLGDEEKLVGLF